MRILESSDADDMGIGIRGVDRWAGGAVEE
jgi:hypothetical protein